GLRVLRGEGAHDRVRLVEDEAVVLDHRDEAARILREVVRLVVAAESTAHVHALVLEAELVGAPHHLLYVDGREPPDDAEHQLLAGGGFGGGISMAGPLLTSELLLRLIIAAAARAAMIAT